jgi:prevent-host-death family protein
MQRWQLQDAKARMSELVKRAQEGPQGITLHGKPVAVMVSQETFEAMSRAQGSLVDFMQASPLAKLPEADEAAFEQALKRGRSRTRKVPKL